MYVRHEIVTDLKVGQSFKKGDILIYNSGFFKKDYFNNQVNWKHGTLANIGIMEISGTFEDSSVITQEFGERLNISPTFERLIQFNKTDVIAQCKFTGDQVSVNDRLIVIENSDVAAFTMDMGVEDDVSDFLIGLNRVAPKAKYTGEIVEMTAFYGCELKDMHPSIQRILKRVIELQDKQAKFSEGTSSEFTYNTSVPLPKDAKYKGVQFDENTVVIKFLIRESLNAGIGDKIVINPSLKSVIAEVMVEPDYAEDGRKLDMLFSGSSIQNRIVMSPIMTGIAEQNLIHLEKEIINIWKS